MLIIAWKNARVKRALFSFTNLSNYGIIFLCCKGGNGCSPRGGDCMSTNDVLTLGLLIVAVIDLVYKIVAKK